MTNIADRINKAISENATLVRFIEQNQALEQTRINNIVSEVLQKINDRVSQEQHQQSFQALKQPKEAESKATIFVVVNEAIESGIDHWNDLVEYCAESGYSINNVKPANGDRHNNRYYYEDIYLGRVSRGQYGLTRQGEIIG